MLFVVEWRDPTPCCSSVWTYESYEITDVIWHGHKAQKQGRSVAYIFNVLKVTIFMTISKTWLYVHFLLVSGRKNCGRTCSRCRIWLYCQIHQQLPDQPRQKESYHSSIILMCQLNIYNPHRLPAKQAFCLSVILQRSHIYHHVSELRKSSIFFKFEILQSAQKCILCMFDVQYSVFTLWVLLILFIEVILLLFDFFWCKMSSLLFL